MSKVLNLLKEKILIADGAMGTMLQDMGLPFGYAPDLWAVEEPEKVAAVHRKYIDAGCNIITTDTFGTNRLKMAEFGKDAAEVAVAGVKLLKKAIADSGKKDVFAFLDIGPTGRLLKPMGDLDFNEAVNVFAEVVKAGADAGADGIIIETMSDLYELKAAVLAAKENSSLPVFCTMVFDEKGKLLTGADVETAAATLEGLGADAIGLNCGMGPDGMLPIVRRMRNACSLPLIVNPNAGLPKTKDGRTYFDVTPELFAKSMEEILEYASVVGGCCGTTPEHIKALGEVAFGKAPNPIPEFNKTVVTSYAQRVEIGKKPVIIGERINPTGKKLFKEALKSGDGNYALREAAKQEEAGAHILDVNVGLPGIDEPKILEETVLGIQRITALPLQIDTSDSAAMERALRVYNGKPLINSVNGKEESMNAVLPLVKKYGGVVVALTLDEDGIPETPEGRLKIAKKILDKAAELGIQKRDIIIDPLTLPVSAGKEAAEVTLTSLEMIKNQLLVNTVLGVSNVSFGLPDRRLINSAFYTLALEKGLSCGIINPCSQDMMAAYDAYCALKGFDENFETYIKRHAGEKAPVAAASPVMSLGECIIKGMDTDSAKSAEALSKNQDVLDIIANEIVPALDKVGKGFEEGSIFLPQLLMSAEAAKAAFDVLTPLIKKEGVQKGEKIVLATVKGDIHDIGKNIVRVLLENYQFDCIDLGKDVPPEAVVDAVKKDNVKLVGLSALMTTTVPSMEETIALLKKECPDTKVMVGGAVMTADFAKEIKADFYGKDAMEDVRIAQKFFGV